jgi:hypothetical protein
MRRRKKARCNKARRQNAGHDGALCAMSLAAFINSAADNSADSRTDSRVAFFLRYIPQTGQSRH